MTPKVRFKLERPEWGAMVRVHGQIVKQRSVDKADGETVHTFWKRSELEEPVDAMFVGYRTLREGKTSWTTSYSSYEFEPPDDIRAFTANNHFEGWLVVTGPQRRPFFALPVDVEHLTD